jgi:energy-coupling factor transporter ATP-binding protein EcfA2
MRKRLSVIDARDLTFTYLGSSKPSISDLTFSVNRGQFVVLTGPSGCGKTSVCRCLNGLIPHFYSGELQGDVIVCGSSVRDKPTSELARKVGFVFQNPENQLFSLSVERDVAFGPENLGLPRNETRERVEWALEVTGISSLRDRAPYELSGGQQQRAAISAVLAMKPEVMVLDEPTSFLDPKSAAEILKVVHGLNRKFGMTIVLVEHRLDLASQYADRVIIMDKGKIILDGKPSEVYNERARMIGVGIPRITFLAQLLQKDGLTFSSMPLTVDEASATLRRSISP